MWTLHFMINTPTLIIPFIQTVHALMSLKPCPARFLVFTFYFWIFMAVQGPKNTKKLSANFFDHTNIFFWPLENGRSPKIGLPANIPWVK